MTDFEHILVLPGYLPATIPCRLCHPSDHAMFFVKAVRDHRSATRPPYETWFDPLHVTYCCPIQKIWCELPSKTVVGRMLV